MLLNKYFTQREINHFNKSLSTKSKKKWKALMYIYFIGLSSFCSLIFATNAIEFIVYMTLFYILMALYPPMKIIRPESEAYFKDCWKIIWAQNDSSEGVISKKKDDIKHLISNQPNRFRVAPLIVYIVLILSIIVFIVIAVSHLQDVLVGRDGLTILIESLRSINRFSQALGPVYDIQRYIAFAVVYLGTILVLIAFSVYVFFWGKKQIDKCINIIKSEIM